MGKYTQMLEGGKFSKMLAEKPSVDLSEMFPEEGPTTAELKERAWAYEGPQAILSPTQIRDMSSSNEQGVADLSNNSDEHYSSIANAQFFRNNFALSGDDAIKQEKMIGRALYGNQNLTSYQINSLIQQDINAGTFNRRAQLSKWTQHGIDERTAEQIDDIYHSTWTDNVAHYLGAPVGGIAKSFFGLVSGAGDVIKVDTPMSDWLIEGIEKEQKYYLDDALIRGNYPDYLAGMTAKSVGDVGGNLWLMGRSIKAANAWTGGKMTLAAKGRTWKELAKSTAKRSMFLAGLNYVKTKGTPKEKMQSAMLTLAYMNTPVISSLSGTHAQAFLSDFILNSGITASYNPQTEEFEFGGQYKQAWEDAKETAENTGADPRIIMVGNIIPILGADVAFSALTRSIRQQSDLPSMRKFTEAQSLIESKSVSSTAEMGRALESKYGKGWESSMSDADRTRYNATKTIENAVKNGKIDPELLKAEEPPTKARIEIDEGVYYRDSDGELRPATVADKEVTVPTEKEVAKEDKERQALVRKITKKPPTEFDFEYRRSIDEIQKSLLTGLSKKKAAELEGAVRYLEQNPDAEMPDRIKKNLEKTPVDQLPIEDLRVVADEIDRLRTVGKTKFKLAKSQRKADLKAEAESIASNFKKPTKKALKEAEKERVAGKKKRPLTIKYVEERPAQFFDRIDGGKGKFDGPAHERFVNSVNRANAQELANTDARTKGFEKLVGNIGRRMRDFGAKVDIDGEKLTLQQVVGIYALSKNRLGYNALLHGNFKDKNGEAIIDKANAMVDGNPQLKMAADYILYDFASNSDRVFDAIGKTEGIIPKREEFYIPLERAGDDAKTGADDVFSQVMERQNIISQTPKDTFKIDREMIPEKYQTPVNLDIFNLWERNVATQEHYIANAQNIKDMREVANNMRSDLKQSYGDAATKYIDEYVDVIANPMSIYGRKDFEVLSRRLRKNVATAYLAGNIKTMIKQSPSLMFYLGETTPKYLSGAVAEMVGAFDKDGRNAIIDFVAEKDPLVKHSHLQRELAELQNIDKTKYDQVMSKVGDVGFKGIVEIDKMVRSAGWYATYKYAKEKLGLSDEAAVEKARNATLRTQPTAAAKDLPPLYRTNEGLNWILMFSNQLNQIWNMQTKEIPKLMKSGQIRKGLSKQGGLALSAMMMWAINNGKPLPEDEEELGEAFSDQAISSIPAVGSQVMAGTKGYENNNAIMEVFNRAGKMYVKVASGEEIPAKDYYDMFFSGLGPALGVPTVATKRVMKAAKEGDIGELTGIKKK